MAHSILFVPWTQKTWRCQLFPSKIIISLGKWQGCVLICHQAPMRWGTMVSWVNWELDSWIPKQVTTAHTDEPDVSWDDESLLLSSDVRIKTHFFSAWTDCRHRWKNSRLKGRLCGSIPSSTPNSCVSEEMIYPFGVEVSWLLKWMSRGRWPLTKSLPV